MKKVTSALLVTALAVSVTGQVSAEEIKQPAPIVQNVDVNNLWKQIDTFQATVVLQNEKYKVTYDDNDGIVHVKIKKETGKEEIEVTGQEASDKVVEFVKDLDLSKNLSKEEVINRLSAALGVEPSEVEKADADITLTNHASLSFSYKQGEKTQVINPYELQKLDAKLEAKDGSFYHIRFLLNKNGIQALVKEKTEDGSKTYKGSAALEEIHRIKDGLIPANVTTWNGYLDQVSDVLGVEVTDITKADLKVHFANNTKVDVDFNR
jgi:hypothetical protein